MSRSTVYANRGRTPRNCFTCDGVNACRCDAVTMRAAKRGAKALWAKRAANDYEDHLAEQAEPSYPECDGEDCIICGSPHENWMEWLRSREVYPAPALRVPVIPRAA